VRWEELRDIYPSEFNILNAPDRVAETGDLWASILEQKHDVSAMLAAVEETAEE
jgi:DNA primase